MSDRVNNISIPLNELRPLVLEAFKRSPQSQYRAVCNEVAAIAVNLGIVPNPRCQTGGSI